MNSIPVFRLTTSTAAAVILEELLAPFPFAVSVYTSRGKGRVEIYLDRPAVQCREVEDLLTAWRDLLPDPVESELSNIPEENWAETWKQYFHPLRASARLAICPTWESLPPSMADADCVIRIDPGMSFGTGRHGTTLACLRFLDRLAAAAPGGPLLDVGCGSGILAIAAAQLGFRPIVAFDIDPDAVVIARENLALNSIDCVDCRCADLAAFTPASPFPIVVANLEGRILLSLRERLVACLDRSGVA